MTKCCSKGIREDCECYEQGISEERARCHKEEIKCNQEIEKKTIVVDKVEYETEDHDKDEKLSDIKIPKGWRLWTAEECIKLKNWNEKNKNKLNLKDCWFFIKQPFDFNIDCIAWFSAYSDGANLDCYWNPSGSYADLGVRFCRDVKK